MALVNVIGTIGNEPGAAVVVAFEVGMIDSPVGDADKDVSLSDLGLCHLRGLSSLSFTGSA